MFKSIKSLIFTVVMALAVVLPCFISLPCYAMTFNQPVKLGEFRFDMNRDTGFHFEGGQNKGTHHYSNVRKQYTNGYGKGIVTYLNAGEKLYLDYDIKKRSNRCYFGEPGNYIENGAANCFLYKIKGSNGMTFYVLYSAYEVADFTVFGKYTNGKFVKYLDSKSLNKNYFGGPYTPDGKSVWIDYKDFRVEGNKLIVPYSRPNNGGPINGEFIFPWDDNAQWFGIERRDL